LRQNLGVHLSSHCSFSESNYNKRPRPVLHLGPVAAGRGVALDDQLRQEFAYKNGILAYDSELDSVVESIYGNRKDHYMLIRGVADYKDGTRRKEWQQYAALMAASVLKSIIVKMDQM